MIDAPTQSFVFLFTQWARVDLGPPSLIGQIWEPGSQKSRISPNAFPLKLATDLLKPWENVRIWVPLWSAEQDAARFSKLDIYT